MNNITNQDRNSDLGLASRQIALSLSSMIHKNYDEQGRVDDLQDALIDYGKALTEKIEEKVTLE